MEIKNLHVDDLLRMGHSPIHNYTAPGLTSWLVGLPHEAGSIRLLTSEIEQQNFQIPHSRRYDAQYIVLRGAIEVQHWKQMTSSIGGDLHETAVLHYCGMPGKYTTESHGQSRWTRTTQAYVSQVLYLRAEDVCSLRLMRQTALMLLQGPTLRSTSIILEPVVNGKRVPLFKVEPWMFQKGD